MLILFISQKIVKEIYQQIPEMFQIVFENVPPRLHVLKVLFWFRGERGVNFQ